MSQATEVYAHEFDERFFRLPDDIQRRIGRKITEMGSRLRQFPHQRMTGMSCFRLRIGDYRVIYEFNAAKEEIYLITLGHRREVYRRGGP